MTSETNKKDKEDMTKEEIEKQEQLGFLMSKT